VKRVQRYKEKTYAPNVSGIIFQKISKKPAALTQINPNFARTPLQASEKIRSRGKQNKDRKQQTKPPVAKSETREAAQRPSTGQAGCKSKLPESVPPQDNQRTICRAAISYPLKQETICPEPIILPPTNLNRQQTYTLTLGQDKDLRAAYSRLNQ
ncbi:hypothetical protein, partial [Prevotella multiformis]|uniref:hypothetical protein n=1 Tax=Prevotella multiformis TaxID=282402 RepID=UPI003FA10CFA